MDQQAQDVIQYQRQLVKPSLPQKRFPYDISKRKIVIHRTFLPGSYRAYPWQIQKELKMIKKNKKIKKTF